MAGIKQAQAGMLGINVATLGLAAVLGIAVMAGKSMLSIAEDSRRLTTIWLRLSESMRLN